MQIIALRVVNEALLEESAIAYPHFVPEYPRTRVGRELRSIAAEHAALVHESTFEPPVPAAGAQLRPGRRLDREVGRRSLVSLAQGNRLHVRDACRQPRAVACFHR